VKLGTFFLICTDLACSSLDYVRELASMSGPQPPSNISPVPQLSPATAAAPNPTSFFANNGPYKLFASSANSQPDPDQEGVIWHEPEAYSAHISRREHPRDPTSLLSLRDALLPKTPTEELSSRFSSLSVSVSRMVSGTSPSAWPKAAVEVTKQAVDGEVTVLTEPEETAGKILHDLEADSTETHSQLSASTCSYTSSSNFEAHIRRAQASSILSVDSDVSDTTIVPDNGNIQLPTPPSEENKERDKESLSDSSFLVPTTSTFTNSLTSGLSNAMRYMLKPGEPSRPSSPFKNQRGLLSTDSLVIDEKPHIKYDWTIGKRLRFTCTAYYATQFDVLRRRCGVDDVFLKSLTRSTNWAAEGGKSRSNFWKTSDDRFIIKSLVNAWNVADL
jgi:1-phosphatidylinositol-3-phosphate 5-kinase